MATMIAALQTPRPSAVSTQLHDTSFLSVISDNELNATKDTFLSNRSPTATTSPNAATAKQKTTTTTTMPKPPKKEEDKKKDLLTDPFDILVEMRKRKRLMNASRRSAGAASAASRKRSTKASSSTKKRDQADATAAAAAAAAATAAAAAAPGASVDYGGFIYESVFEGLPGFSWLHQIIAAKPRQNYFHSVKLFLIFVLHALKQFPLSTLSLSFLLVKE